MAVQMLGRLTSLTKLNLSRRNVRYADLAHLVRSLPKLKHLMVVQCCVPMPAAAAIWELSPDLIIERRGDASAEQEHQPHPWQQQ